MYVLYTPARRPVAKDRRCEVEIVLRANSLRLSNKPHLLQGHAVHEECRQEFAAFWDCHVEDPLFGRNIIVRSVCPQIYGMLVVKLAILLTIIGGVEQVSSRKWPLPHPYVCFSHKCVSLFAKPTNK